jgi:glutamyl-tRNA reductase
MNSYQSHHTSHRQVRSAAPPLLVGLDHRSAPLELRERLSVEGDDLSALLRSLREEPLTEVVVISTCHRLEVYAIASDAARAESAIIEQLALRLATSPDALRSALYRVRGPDAARHLLRVAAGLESLVVGEAQIQGQVADAFQAARAAHTCGPNLSRLLSTALHTGKRARSETRIGRQTLSISHAAARLVARDLGDLAGLRTVMIGAGEMAALALQALRAQGARDLTVVSRTFERAHALAGRYQAEALPWSQRARALEDAHAVVIATRAPHLLLRVEDFASRRDQEQPDPQPRPVIVDISVPRAVDPAVRSLAGLRLYDIDDLHAIVTDDQHVRREDIVRVERIIDAELASHLAGERSRSVAPVIAALRQKAWAVAQAEVERALRRAPDLDEREQDVVREMAHRIVAKLLHDPTVSLKERAARGEHLTYLHAARNLFALQEDDETSENGSNDEER